MKKNLEELKVTLPKELVEPVLVARDRAIQVASSHYLRNILIGTAVVIGANMWLVQSEAFGFIGGMATLIMFSAGYIDSVKNIDDEAAKAIVDMIEEELKKDKT